MMDADGSHGAKDAAPVLGPIPPYLVLNNFLDEESVACLLDYAVQSEVRFKTTTIRKGTIDPSRRISVGLRDLGPMKGKIKKRLTPRAPSLTGKSRVTPLCPARTERERLANGDGSS